MKRVGILGAGTMGHGIAQVCAMSGFKVTLADARTEALEHAEHKIQANLAAGVKRGKVSEETAALALKNLQYGDLQAAATQADIVIEAVPEVLSLKQSLFASVEEIAPAHCILGTNTSSLSISKIAKGLKRPGQVIGTHFFNPVHIMALLEVIVADSTSEEVVTSVLEFGEKIGKTCIRVGDHPGFATSRLGICLGMEAIRMVESEVASAEDIDKAMVLGYRHPVGPLKLTDLVGLDVRLAIGDYLADELKNEAFRPPQLMRDMVKRGTLGKKTGQGFYTW